MKDLLLHNWHLKLISIGLAAVLWAEVARTPTSEISVSVALEYENMPEQTDVFGDTGDRVDRVEVRLRGPSASLRTITAQDISLSIDMRNITSGQQRVIPLSPEMVSAPFGVEVVRVFPARVRLTVEPLATKLVRIVPVRTGLPAEGVRFRRRPRDQKRGSARSGERHGCSSSRPTGSPRHCGQ